MSVVPLKDGDKPSFDGRIHTCPLRGHSTSFQLVDELGDGKPYAGLAYEVTDYENVSYTGKLDASGSGKVDNHYCGPVVLKLNQPYQGSEKAYTFLRERPHYPLPITELQVRAEKTRFFNKSGARTEANPAQGEAITFYQVEVRELVDHSAHLPPIVQRHFPPNTHVFSLFRQKTQVKNPKTQQTGFIDGGKNVDVTPYDSAMAELGNAPPARTPLGVALMPNRHTVLEVRPLRALRPMLSPSNDFCALNLYQLALMSTLSYSDFGQQPTSLPVENDSVSFPLQPSIGNWFGDALSKFDELWQVDAAQAGSKAYYPLYEEVPYSKRLEMVPFDPELYSEVNSPSLGEKQENPASIHCFDDSAFDDGTDTQAFITHHDTLILISIRGTAGGADALRDMDATQVPFGEWPGKVHSGFYGAAKVAYDFVDRYLDKFYNGQKLVITGHSLGGAIALIVSEMLRRNKRYAADIVLYTYGSPRAGDKVFVEGASPLIHHRTVNHNDPVPSVPSTWMDTSTKREYIAQGVVTVISPPVGVSWFALGMINITGEPYTHHGTLRHFMPVNFGAGKKSSILWMPGCSTINDHGCAKALKATDGLPDRGSFLRQIVDNADHKMVLSYIPNCWASLRRWQEAQEFNRTLVTDNEFELVDGALKNVQRQLLTLERRLAASPDRYVDSQAATKAALQQEIENIGTTRTRLDILRGEPVTESHVYGLFAGLPELIEGDLPRWKAHPENTTQEQLAMSPPPAYDDDRAIAAITGGHTVGAPCYLDIDSIA
ncbi:lipase family protein [Pseudomonas sp. B21-015]|uniref:lipase family protein n=1 Tax=Pseudomonas sp. B21-015 TaxID=2895473 RepID=UPI00216004A6|nr:lipase family protein [Pseudomonas sp. B21-015]UVM48538.1 lipase family protein [Pseudomonas sp. B21-015]